MPDTPLTEPTPPSTETVAGGLKPNVAAGIACIFTVISGIIFLMIEKKNQFVRFWAMQSLLLGLLYFAVIMVFAIAHFILGQMPFIGGVLNFALGVLRWAFQVGWFVVYLICVVRAFSNQEWEIPWLGKIARAQLAKGSTGMVSPRES